MKPLLIAIRLAPLAFICLAGFAPFDRKVLGQNKSESSETDTTANGKLECELFAKNADGTFVCWKNIVGKSIAMEGIYTGYRDKTPGPLLVNHCQMFLKGNIPEDDDLRGRLVRVSGVMQVVVYKRAPPGYQAPPPGKYYYIDVRRLEVIDRVLEEEVKVLADGSQCR